MTCEAPASCPAGKVCSGTCSAGPALEPIGDGGLVPEPAPAPGACRTDGDTCSLTGNPACCSGLTCSPPKDCPGGRCGTTCQKGGSSGSTCNAEGDFCSTTGDPACCSGLKCLPPKDCPGGRCGTTCQKPAPTCLKRKTRCKAGGTKCCSGLQCSRGRCRLAPQSPKPSPSPTKKPSPAPSPAPSPRLSILTGRAGGAACKQADEYCIPDDKDCCGTMVCDLKNCPPNARCAPICFQP